MAAKFSGFMPYPTATSSIIYPSTSIQIIDVLNYRYVSIGSQLESISNPTTLTAKLTAENVGKIYQYIGNESGTNYRYGYYYKVITDYETTPTYSFAELGYYDGKPIEVDTSTSMPGLAIAKNLGRVYKYTGTSTGLYTNGDIYEVIQSDGSYTFAHYYGNIQVYDGSVS